MSALSGQCQRMDSGSFLYNFHQTFHHPYEARNGEFPNTRIYVQYTVQSRFATVRFTTIHFYDPCPVGPSTPDLWCIAVSTQESFQLFSGVHVFLLILFQCSSTKVDCNFSIHDVHKKDRKEEKSKQLTLHSFLVSSEPRPGPYSTK